MSTALKRLMRKEILSIGTVLISLAVASAQSGQDGDLLRQAREQRELATQKAESDLRTAFNKLNGLTAAEKLALLRQTLSNIEANNDLDPSRKDGMIQTLKRTIRNTETDARSRGEGTDPIPASQKRDRDATRRAEAERAKEENQKVDAAIREIDRLNDQGQTQLAERQARELAVQYPNNRAAQTMNQRQDMRSRLRQARELLDQQNKNLKLALDDKTPTLPDGNFGFNREQHERNLKSKYRGFGPALSKKEQAILDALAKTVHPDWQNVKFDSVIESLQKMIGVTIAVDRKALEDANIGTDSLVTFSLPQAVTTRTVLRKILADKGLGYVVRDEMIYVTTLNAARDMMTTRTYPIGDLVTPVAPIGMSPDLIAEQEKMVVKYIIDSIKRSVDPMSWEGEGGKATISYEPITKSLVIRQSAEIHMIMRGSSPR